jgi:hypothetical protein
LQPERVGVADLWRGDVRVALGGRDTGVAQELLDDADADALLDEERGRSAPGIVEASVTDVGLLRDGFPLSPVFGAADRAVVVLAEAEVMILPVICHGTF